MSARQPHNPPSIRAPFAAYSHGVSQPLSGRLLVISGQLGAMPDDRVPEDVEAQATICFENIAAILADAGMSFDDVVRLGGFVTDRAYFPIIGAVRARYLPRSDFASTLVVVSGFTRPEFKVEVEAMAIARD